MAEDNLTYGERVFVSFGLDDVVGTVHEVYGPRTRRHVVIALTPEVSGDMFDEPTTVSVPLDAVRRVTPVA